MAKPAKLIPLRKENTPVAAFEKRGGERQLDKDRKKDIPHPRMQFNDENKVEKAKKRSMVGLQYLAGDISGGNTRCIAMLQAFQESIKDYTTPPDKALARDLTAKINTYVSFLIECRPLSMSMGNAIRFLKSRVTNLSPNLSEVEAKAHLISNIDRFIEEKIILAFKVIVKHTVTKIRDGDVLLTYGSSFAVEMIFSHAHELGRKFRVVIVDSRPKLEGSAGLWVFLGASSVLSNGAVYSRVGTACVAMVANQFRVPVMICCEAYKFHERVQLDSICSNELGARRWVFRSAFARSHKFSCRNLLLYRTKDPISHMLTPEHYMAASRWATLIHNILMTWLHPDLCLVFLATWTTNNNNTLLTGLQDSLPWANHAPSWSISSAVQVATIGLPSNPTNSFSGPGFEAHVTTFRPYNPCPSHPFFGLSPVSFLCPPQTQPTSHNPLPNTQPHP
ncbi:NagB/RpiA/CoA transferase-like superfamily protein [Striga hermonthica]|uniref:Translation initiation factor eIF2B subunit delta n=1 Tax=Striga hermonthica TaxID=68872 RepID=A0A9N7NEU5_STRHE|nr:NagB/RpiA/CoA transferase-like superfamily protein [Striga hermonthica]